VKVGRIPKNEATRRDFQHRSASDWRCSRSAQSSAPKPRYRLLGYDGAWTRWN